MASNQRRALFVLTNHDQLGSSGKKTGWYLPECAHPYHEFTSAGWKVDFCSPSGGNCPADPNGVSSSANDPVSTQFYQDQTIQNRINSSKRVDDVNFEEYDCVFVVGGHGPMWDEVDCKPLQDKLANFYTSSPSHIVAAVCLGPAALLNCYVNGAPLLQGKTVTCFTNSEEKAMKLDAFVPFLLEDRVKERGAVFKPAENMKECVHCSDQLCTGQNPASAGPLAKQIMALCNNLLQQQGQGTQAKQAGSVQTKLGTDASARQAPTALGQPGM
jgi:putative intracellular protease/amidase